MVLSKNEFLYLIVVVAAGFLLLVLFFFYLLFYNVKIRKQKEIEKLNAILETQENERRRIAEDMHDEVGPMLSAIKLQISNFAACPEEDLEEQIKQTSAYLDTVIQHVRTVVRNLSSKKLKEHGLVQSIIDIQSRVEKDSRIKFSFQQEGINGQMKETTEANVYRIISEMVNNSIKHSNCSEINLVLRMYEQNKLLLMYTDDGKVNRSPEGKTGMGLNNIISRVNILNGKLFTLPDFSHGAFYYITIES